MPLRKPALPVFEKCCGCIELRKGCLIIGYCLLCCGILDIVLLILGFVFYGTPKRESRWPQEPMKEEDNAVPYVRETSRHSSVFFISTIYFVFVIQGLGFVYILLIGLHKNKAGHLRAFLIYAVFFLPVYMLHYMICLLFGLSLVYMISGIVFALLLVYSMLVIRSMFIKMKTPIIPVRSESPFSDMWKDAKDLIMSDSKDPVTKEDKKSIIEEAKKLTMGEEKKAITGNTTVSASK